MIYDFFVENQVFDNGDLEYDIMLFLGIYLVFLNLIPLTLSIKITQKKEQVERYNLDSTAIIDKE